ncbi:unnamed protein product [Menidia menidia]|uniref:Leucine-rich repeat protein SHOC-2 n=1 Tax=Menidia menidia TaxID=238744 RepID=A0A8S4ASF0_9TELE|nr:unnamed protein product [Menidia menidia]
MSPSGRVKRGRASCFRHHGNSPGPESIPQSLQGGQMDTPSFSVKEQVVRALYGRSTSLGLNGKKLEDVPACVSRLPNLRVLSLSHNRLSFLPSELVALQQLTELNLGNNALKEVPAVLGHLEALKKLYLFRNQITVLPPDVIGRLRNLVVLNLNHNQIVRLPPEITSLRKLQRLSLLDNSSVS